LRWIHTDVETAIIEARVMRMSSGIGDVHCFLFVGLFLADVRLSVSRECQGGKDSNGVYPRYEGMREQDPSADVADISANLFSIASE
jgi:hypothetical protein